MENQCLLVREFEVNDPDNERFWLEIHVFYYPNDHRIEMRLSGSDVSVLTIEHDSVWDIHQEALGFILRDVVPTTLDSRLRFIPESHIESSRISQFCHSPECQFDFYVNIFKSIKDLKIK